MAGALASRANASEKPTLVGTPSGRLPSRSKCMASETPIAAERKRAASAAASSLSRMSSESPCWCLRKTRLKVPNSAERPSFPKLLRLGHRQQFDEEARQLDQVIVRAPRMLVARAHTEAEATIKLGRGLEIAHGMDDM